MLDLSPEQHRELMAALAPMDERYDPAERMIRVPFHSPGYHTTLKGGFTHPTRDSLGYAVALLDSGEDWRLDRARDILNRVIALQDQESESRTYGIWSWFMEEPLDKMSPPDWNWADFNGTHLLQVAIYHRDRLPKELAERVDEALYHAARSIQRRDVRPGYTNIAFMGTYVTYVTAERYDISDLLEYAQARLKRVYEHTLYHDGFTEFNSPTYTVVALRVVARMLDHIQDMGALAMIRAIHDIGWRDVARHFHAPTWQWAGPHSRCYETLLRPGYLAFIEQACQGEVLFFAEGERPPSVDGVRLDVNCPVAYRAFFAREPEPHDVVQTFIRGGATLPEMGVQDQPPVIGTTHLERGFALGSCNRLPFWNQHRPLVAYWGTQREPRALQVRFLHDGYDYSSAQCYCVQAGGCVLAGVNFATDYGDTHISLDKVKGGAIRARDLRLRFEFFGMPADWLPAAPKLGQTTVLDVDGCNLDLCVAAAALGDWPISIETGREGDNACLELVLYSGQEREVAFADLEQAFALFGLSMYAEEAKGSPQIAIRYQCAGDRLEAAWDIGGEELELAMYRKPAPIQLLHSLAPTRGG